MITIGTDPEFFVYDGDKIGSVIGRLGGTKEEPRQLEWGGVQEDNVLAEINPPPATTSQEFIYNITNLVGELERIVGPLAIQSSHEYEIEALKSYGPAALRFGCDPDYNAWTEEMNEPPNPFTTLRTASGHIAIGYPGVSESNNFLLAKLCDLFIGVPSVLMDDDVRRRELYGKAGAMRHKPFGMEYRTPSNFWLRSEETMDWAFNAAVTAATHLPDGHAILSEVSEYDLQHIINTSDKGQATELCQEYGVAYV